MTEHKADISVSEALGHREKIAEFKAKKMEERRPLEQRLNEISEERAELSAMPVSRESLIARAHREIDIIADDYLQSIVSVAGRKIRNVTVDELVRVPGHNRQLMSLSYRLRGSSIQLGDFNTEPLTQGAATFLFRDAMKSAAERQIMALDFSPETDAGISIDVARERLAALDMEASKIHVMICEIDADIEAVEGKKQAVKREHVGELRKRIYCGCEVSTQAVGSAVRVSVSSYNGGPQSALFSVEEVGKFCEHLATAYADSSRGDDHRRIGAEVDRHGWAHRRVKSIDGKMSLNVAQKKDEFMFALHSASTLQVHPGGAESFREMLKKAASEVA
jgi:hypothetical protein